MNSIEIVGNNLSPKHSNDITTNINNKTLTIEHFNQNCTIKNETISNDIVPNEFIPNHVPPHKPAIQRQSHLSPTDVSNDTNLIYDNQQQLNHVDKNNDNSNSPVNATCDDDQCLLNETIDTDYKIAIANLNASIESLSTLTTQFETLNLAAEARGSIASKSSGRKSRIVIRKFQKLDESVLSSTPAPDVKIGQRVAYKEYYGNEFGTIRWIGRVPQICPDWTVGVEFDNAIGEGDGSLNGRRYFIAKDCFAKFLPLNSVALVDQHVGRPEPGTMISVMSAAVRPGQMISIQRVSTVHVQHCFLNAPHRRPGADILAVNTRLHCQCPNCGPCAHVIKPPRTQRLARGGKNATHMCQFSTYTCCGMESQEETMCTYEGNKVISLPPPATSSSTGLLPVGNSWIEGAGYLTNLQAQQSKLMPEEYKLGAAPEDIGAPSLLRRGRHNKSTTSSRRGSGKHHRSHHKRHKSKQKENTNSFTDSPLKTTLLNSEIKSDPYNNNNNYSDPAFNAIYESNTDNNYSPTPMDLVPYNSSSPLENSDLNNNPFAIAQQDKQTSYYHEESREENENHKVWNDNSIDQIIESNRGKIVYRDSIENRYLFPTDDPIDSTLEQDLENLSQARYGHCNNSRPNSSKNIFKSLRSLVSCLGEQTNNSEFDKRHSPDSNSYNDQITNTMKYSENYGIVAKPNNKSIPYEMKTERYTKQQQMIHSNCEVIEEKNRDNMSHSSSFTPSNDWKQKNYYQNQQTNHQAIMKKDLLNYSSSDCGFSSASQNSINFRAQSNNYGCPISADSQVYHRIITRLMNSTSMKEEDILKLKELIIGSRDGCCLHNKTMLNNYGSTDIDQIIADVIKNTYLSQDKTSISAQRTNSTICCHSKNTYYHVDDKTENTCFNAQYDKIKDSFYTNCQNDNCNHPQRSVNGGSTGESATLSSNDSFSESISTSEIGKKKNLESVKVETKNHDNNLPKAFELKLTLSISDKAKTESSTECNKITDNSLDESNKIVVNDIPSPLINSKFDININPNLNGQLSSTEDKEILRTIEKKNGKNSCS